MTKNYSKNSWVDEVLAAAERYRIQSNPATVTITIASPAVISWSNHGLAIGDAVVFATTGALPTGLTAGAIYYIIAAGFTANSFEVSASLGGSAINTSGTQSGVQSAYWLLPTLQILLETSVSVAGSALSAAWMNNIENGVDLLDTEQSDTFPITTGGTSTAYTLATTGATALTTGEKWRVKFHTTAGATPTLNRDSKGAKNLKYYDSSGAKQSAGASQIAANMYTEILYDGTDYVIMDQLPANISWGNILGTLTSQTDLLYAVEPQQGFVRNGKISATVASNNLTVALKTLAGNDPSASEPVYVYLGGGWRTVTAALSVVMNAGTNWMNSGASEHATLERDYFAYLGYNATDGVVIGVSRIPYAKQYSDFNVTNTNERFAAISTITHASANDEYAIIARFAATLSASASFNWSVPTFTPTNLVQHPIYETRWMDWTPTIVGYSANPAGVPSPIYKFRLRNDLCDIILREANTGTSNSASLTYSVPFASIGLSGYETSAMMRFTDSGTIGAACGWMFVSASATVINFGKTFTTSNGFTATGGKCILDHSPFAYRIN